MSKNTLESNVRKPVIAIDFDGTIVDHEFPEIGLLKPHAARVIRDWYNNGYNIIIWTCRNNTELNPDWVNAPISAVIRFLKIKNIPFHTVNEQQQNLGFHLQSRKIFADVYIDDRNLGGFPGWLAAEKMVRKQFENVVG